jgi:hypothetical protein
MKDDKLVTFLGMCILAALSYMLCGGMLALIFLCFDITFTWKLVTGIWLSLVLLKIAFMVYKK